MVQEGLADGSWFLYIICYTSHQNVSKTVCYYNAGDDKSACLGAIHIV